MEYKTRYENSSFVIIKVPGGYILTIKRRALKTHLLIRNDGAMLNVDGGPIYLDDQKTASWALEFVSGGARVAKLLHKGAVNPEIVALLQQYRPHG